MRSAGWSGTTTRCLEGSKGLQHDMTAALMDSVVPKTVCQDRKRAPAQIARQLHASVSSSSQTHRLGERAVKAIRFHGFPYVVPQFRP